MTLQIICDECSYILFSEFKIMNHSTGTLLDRLLKNVNNICPNCQNKLSKNYDYEVLKVGSR